MFSLSYLVDDQLYGWGSGNYGECGFGEVNIKFFKF